MIDPAAKSNAAKPGGQSAILRDGRFSVWVSRISRALSQQMVLYVRREFGLNLAEYRALTVIDEYRSVSIRDIAIGSQLDKAQVTRAVGNLTKRGLALQVVDGKDRRLRAVKLTPAGRTLIASTRPFAIARQKRLERLLTATELRIVWKALAVLADEAQSMLAEEAKAPAKRRT